VTAEFRRERLDRVRREDADAAAERTARIQEITRDTADRWGSRTAALTTATCSTTNPGCPGDVDTAAVEEVMSLTLLDITGQGVDDREHG
jgi:hypothetical protein